MPTAIAAVPWRACSALHVRVHDWCIELHAGEPASPEERLRAGRSARSSRRSRRRARQWDAQLSLRARRPPGYARCVVAKLRTNRRRIAELAYVLRAILDEIATGTRVTLDAPRAGLDLADAFVRGERTSATRIREASAAVRAEKKDYGVQSPPSLKAISWLPVESLLGMVGSGDDASAHVLTHADYAVPNGDWRVRAARIQALVLEARAHAATIDDTPFPPKKKQVNARAAAAEAALLERSRAALSTGAIALFDSIRPARDRKRTADRKKLTALLRQRALPATEPILAFEEAFGGLLLPTSDLDDWREDGLWLLVGPYAAMTSHHAGSPRGGALGATTPLVPVALGPNDDVYFLDAEGRAYYHETIGEPSAVPFGANGAELVTRLLMGVLSYGGNAWGGTYFEVAADEVEAVAARLGLSSIATGPDFAGHASGDAVIVAFRGMTFAVARTPELAARAKG